jgi:hypothetical protein
VSTFAEIFPPTDPVARFTVAMAIARNDLRYVLFRAGEAVDHDLREANYLIRLATAHFFEAERALREWSKDKDVKQFLDALPAEAKQERKKALSVIQKTGKGVLEHTRDRTFHYPYRARRRGGGRSWSSHASTTTDPSSPTT